MEDKKEKGISAEKYKKLLDFAHSAYEENNSCGDNYRQDGKVPFMNHPIWCATMLLTDTEVPWKEREIGFQALILHDVLEDTCLELPDWIEPEVKEVVKEMTFKTWEENVQMMPQKDRFIKLLELYDKLSSMFENHVVAHEKTEEEIGNKRNQWKKLVIYLVAEVEKNYGNIRAVQIGRAIIENTDW